MMDAITALLNRQSSTKLTTPAPSIEQQKIIFSAALRAPDHGQLRPWYFLVMKDEARAELGNIFANIAIAEDSHISEEQLHRTKQLPLRAPLIVVVVAKIDEAAKIPVVEQLLSAGAAAYAMLVAAHALGLGGVWRTGAMAYHEDVKKALGIKASDHIVGFLYFGTPECEHKQKLPIAVDDYFKNWGSPS